MNAVKPFGGPLPTGPQSSAVDTLDAVTTRRGCFWVGVDRIEAPHGTEPGTPMYVEWEAPEHVTRPYPIVLVHGGGGQGTDWLGTPDGRAGWARLLVGKGFAVYVVDRPGHGRSFAGAAHLGGASPRMPYEAAIGLLGATVPDLQPAPSQWPKGEQALGQFVASSGSMMLDPARAHEIDGLRGSELLDLIGPAILITHSAGSPAGWLTADRRPDLVKAVVALEPAGPPFAQIPEAALNLSWGLTSAPLTWQPPVTDPQQLGSAGTQTHRLPHLADTPVCVVASESSALGLAAGPVVEFLVAAGVPAERLALTDVGVHGNSHALTLEANNAEVLDVVVTWLDEHGVGSSDETAVG